MKAKKYWILAVLVVVSSLILGSVAGAQDDRQGAGIPVVGPRGSVGPDVPLSDSEKKQFAKRVVVEGRTPTAVQSACERAVKEGVRVVLLPAGQYVFEREVRVPGGLTVLGEGGKTLCRTKGRSVHLFRVDGDNVRFTRLKLQGADTSPGTTNNTYGITVSGRQNIRIDHCELLGFSYATNFGSEATAQVDHCFIHHNLRNGLGYGVSIYSGAYVLVIDNEFSQNRHSLASNGALDWSSPKRVGKYLHKPGVRKTHWQFIHNRVGSNDQSPYELCAVDTHPGMDGTFVVERNIFENLRHGVGIRDGSGPIRGNVFQNLRTVTNFRRLVAISISYGTHNNIPVEGCMPHDIEVKDNVFLMRENVKYEKCSLGKAENITIEGKLVPETRIQRAAPAIPWLQEMGEDGVLRWREDQRRKEQQKVGKNPLVRLWDTGKLYTRKNPMHDAWKDRANWLQVPYGKTDYQPRGDLMLEGETFYLFLFTNKDDSVDLMAKLGESGYKPNEIYKVHDTGRRNFGHGTMAVKILHNAAEEIVLEHAGEGRKDKQPVVTKYRVLAGKPWLEVRPVERVNQQGMHGKSRICAFVSKEGEDFILDSKREPFTEEVNLRAPEGTIGIINFNRGYRSDYDFMWFMTFPPGAEKHRLTYLGFHADPFWEDPPRPDRPSVGAQYAYMGEGGVFIGVLNNKDNWKREDVGRKIEAGEVYQTDFEAPYPGEWKLVARLAGELVMPTEKPSAGKTEEGTKMQESAVIWRDELDSYHPRWNWKYSAGTGFKKVADGMLHAGITDKSTSQIYSDNSLHESSLSHQEAIVEMRLRCSDDNKLVSKIGEGTRGWGFWTGVKTPAQLNVAWFLSASAESDPQISGFRAQVIRNGVFLLNQPVSVDMREWHTYRVDMRSSGTRFLVDGKEVASCNGSPAGRHRTEIWIDNYRVHEVKLGEEDPDYQISYLDVHQNQEMWVDWIQLVAVGELAKPTEAANLVKDPGAEGDAQVSFRGCNFPLGWGCYEGAGTAEWGVSTEQAHTGKKSVYMKITDFDERPITNNALTIGATAGYFGQDAFLASSDTTYYFSFWLKGKGFKRQLRIYGQGWKEPVGEASSRQELMTTLGSIMSTEEWTKYEGAFKTKPDTKKLALFIQAYGNEWDAPVGATLWVDDAYICKITKEASGRYIHNRVQIDKAGQAFVFRSPREGILDYIFVYLWDRTEKTPKLLWTPMDVYRRAIK